jgi:hypothetical protein
LAKIPHEHRSNPVCLKRLPPCPTSGLLDHSGKVVDVVMERPVLLQRSYLFADDLAGGEQAEHDFFGSWKNA